MRLIVIWSMCLFLFHHKLSAQTPGGNDPAYTIKGLIVDSVSRQPVSYATVALWQQTDAPLKMTAGLLDGTFSLDLKAVAGKIWVGVSCVGYVSKQIELTISASQKEYDLGIIPCSSGVEIAGVTVVAAKRLVSVDDDKLVYHVDTDPDAHRSQLVDILRKVPMLSVSGLDQVAMNGSADFKVLVNGRRSSMYSKNFSQVIRAIPAANIKQIEVIDNPSSRYDADGTQGVINIVMKKNAPQFLGVLSGAADSYPSYMGTGYFAWTRGKFNASAMVTYKNVRMPYEYYSSRSEILSRGIHRLSEGNSGPKKRSNEELVNLEASYDFNKYNLLTFNINNYSRQINEAPVFNLREFDDQTLLREYVSDSYNRLKRTDLNAGLNFQHTYKKRSQTLTLSYDYNLGMADNNESHFYNGVLNYEDYGKQKKYLSTEDEHTFQLDYYDPLNKKSRFEIGMKYNLRFNNNNTDLYYRQYVDDLWEYDADYKDNMDYTQHVIAGYGGFTYSPTKFSLRIGLRAEGEIDDVRTTEITGKNTFTNHYLNLVPNVLLSYRSKITWRLSYAQSLRRPGISLLNPYVDDSDPEHISYGNPELKPVLTHQIKASMVRNLSGWNFSLGLFSEFSKNPISRYTFVNDKNIYESTYRNLGNRQFYGMNLSVKYQKSGHSFSLVSNAGYLKVDDAGNHLRAEGWRYNIGFDGNVKLYKGGSLFLNAQYRSPLIELQQHEKHGYFTYHLGLRQDMLQSKLNVAIYASNPFSKFNKQTLYTTGANFTSVKISHMEYRVFSLSVTYRFRTADINIKKIRRPIENEEKITNENIYKDN